MYGSEQELSRWRDCVSYVNDNIGNAVGRMFVEEYFDEDAKEIVSVWIYCGNLIIINIETTLDDN